jgi:hypothetical protein
VKRNEICTVYKAYGGSLGEPNMADHVVKDSPRQKGRIADTFYLVSLLTGLLAFSLRRVSLWVSPVGCAIGPAIAGFRLKLSINPLVFFGFYSLLVGYLI